MLYKFNILYLAFNKIVVILYEIDLVISKRFLFIYNYAQLKLVCGWVGKRYLDKLKEIKQNLNRTLSA